MLWEWPPMSPGPAPGPSDDASGVPARCPASLWTFQTFSLHHQPGVLLSEQTFAHLRSQHIKGNRSGLQDPSIFYNFTSQRFPSRSPALPNALVEADGQMDLLRCHGGHLAMRHTGKTLGSVPGWLIYSHKLPLGTFVPPVDSS